MAPGSVSFEVALHPPTGAPMVVGEFSVQLLADEGAAEPLQVHLERGMIAEGLRELAKAIDQTDPEEELILED